ncbi:MAG: hypothetical protein DRP78_01825 [Candidatus Omnitrophota bacterium]|nr:MAG: hypothetical protein DRP78_01825 [Candidatus Omnitrophota bacterium]
MYILKRNKFGQWSERFNLGHRETLKFCKPITFEYSSRRRSLSEGMGKNFKIAVNCFLLSIVFCHNVFAYTYTKAVDEVVPFLLNGNYQKAYNLCSKLEHNAGKNSIAEIFYLQGVCLIHLQDYAQARDVLKKGLRKADSDLAIEIYLGIADTYFMEYSFDKAISIYKQLLTKYKKNEDYLSAVYFKLGKAYQKKSDWVNSEYYFSLLKKKYPQSLETELASMYLSEGNFFTIQVGCFTSKKNALKLCKDLKNKGYESYMTSLKAKKKKLYRVRVGKFVSRFAAEYAQEELKNKEALPTHIFP